MEREGQSAKRIDTGRIRNTTGTIIDTSAFAAAALVPIPSWSLVGGGIAAGVEGLSAAAGRIRG